MSRPISTILFFGAALVTVGACASAPPTCVSGDGFLCAEDLDGFPFARGAVMVSDTCANQPPAADKTRPPCAGVIPPAGATTVSLRQPERGKLCLAGVVEPGGFALLSLILRVVNPTHTGILEPFDAAGRGITQVALAIDSPPSQGVALQAHVVTRRECPEHGLDCFYPPNFKAKDVTVSGPVMVPLADFKSEDDPSVGLDTSVLNDVFFQVGAPGTYDFCVRDFNFLDAAGNQVLP